MDEAGKDEGSSALRIRQLERERDDLQKDIEQLCLQQAGPSYLAVAARIHFQRTAGLEREIENLRKRLTARVRENQNLQEELSEAYRVKAQLADLHSEEVSKNIEAEKQVKFFQGCIASAFAERDNTIMEAEKAKEQQEVLSEKLCDYEHRLQALQSAYLAEKHNSSVLQFELENLKEENESFEKVISKFYEVRERATGLSECKSLEAKCSCLLNDPIEAWIFDNDGRPAPSSYIESLEEQIATLRESIVALQQKMRMGMEIEGHLRRKVTDLEKKQTTAGNLFRQYFSSFHELYSQQRASIMDILQAETTELKTVIAEIQQKMRLLKVNEEQNSRALLGGEKCHITERNQEGVISDADIGETTKYADLAKLGITIDGEPNMSNVLAQAMKEKVEALLLLSQQEERYLLEKDLNQRKMEDLQRTVVQVAAEKVKALVELAQLKKDYQLLQEHYKHGVGHAKCLVDDVDKSLVAQERTGKLKNLLKRAYLGRWVRIGYKSEDDDRSNSEVTSLTNESGNNSLDLARLKVENATLQESISNIGHLTSFICNLRLSLVKVINDSRSDTSAERVIDSLEDIYHQIEHVKTALSSSIPVSWSSGEEGTLSEQNVVHALQGEVSGNGKLDPITATGFEMVELLMLAAELIREKIVPGASSSSLD